MDYVHELLVDNGKTIYKEIDGEFAETKYDDITFRKNSDRLQYMNLKYQ